MTVVIRQEKTTDAATGQSYNYSAEITAKGKTHRGWAVKGLGQFPTE